MDYSTLTAPIVPAELAAYKRSAAVKKRWSTATIAFIVIAGFFAFIVAIVFISSAAQSSVSEAGSFALTLSLMFLIPLIIAFFIFLTYKNKQIQRQYRLEQFGKFNKLSVHLGVKGNGNYPGIIFQVGHSAMLEEWISAMDSTYVVGNYRYVTGSGKNSQTHYNGFMMLQLPRKLPNMVLDGKKNNARIFGMELSNLPTVFKKDQTLMLEGDFNSHFTLYAPKEYERDALYVFTPDLMALLVDNVAQFDAEVVDDKLFIYGTGKFNLLDQSIWERLMRIKEIVGAKIISQTDYYADERVGDRSKNEIASSGKRLKQGVSIASIIFLVIYIIFTILDVFSG